MVGINLVDFDLMFSYHILQGLCYNIRKNLQFKTIIFLVINLYYDNYQEEIQWLETKEKELFGNHFKIYKEDYAIVQKIIAYSIKDEQIAIKLNIDLEKGIILSGTIGCGKTSLMTLFVRL